MRLGVSALTSSPKSKPKIIGIIGTDTEIGKTIVTASLARAFCDLGYCTAAFKPFASDPARRGDGSPFSTDADLLARAAEMAGGEPEARGQLFSTPLAPYVAARLEKRRVDVRLALTQTRALASRHEITLVEGCGGWEVPLTATQTTADYFTSLRAPLVLIARPGLGTVNHIILTQRAVEARGLKILAVILNPVAPSTKDTAEKTNPELIRKFTGLPVWGPIAFRAACAGRTADHVRVASLPDLTSEARKMIRMLS